jgi:GNAT superfamily N-acetyltransferase
LLTRAEEADAAELLALRHTVAAHLAAQHGRVHRTSRATVRGVLWDMRRDTMWIVRRRGKIVAALTLGTRKPWAIDVSCFEPAQRAIYLTGMMVDPAHQRRGLGRRCMDAVREIVAEWPADALRLDAYDRPDGAGEFYRKCGLREVGRVRYRDVPLIYFELRL